MRDKGNLGGEGVWRETEGWRKEGLGKDRWLEGEAGSQMRVDLEEQKIRVRADKGERELGGGREHERGRGEGGTV